MVTMESFDVLSDVLHLAHPRGWIGGDTHLAASSAMHGAESPARFYCVRQGYCQIEFGADLAGVPLQAGDLAFVMPGVQHEICQPPAISNGNHDVTRLTTGGLQFDARYSSPILGALPHCFVVPGVDGRPEPWLDALLRLLTPERSRPQPGSQAVVDHLVQVLFLHVLRIWMARMDHEGTTALRALADPDIGTALRLMHQGLESPWTVDMLARKVCMSRAAFAARFKTLVQQSPLNYLWHCRMRRAAELLTQGHHGIKEIASQVGYTRRSAFSNSFKRWCGQSPGMFCRQSPARHDPRDGIAG